MSGLNTLTGQKVVLYDNGGDALTVSANGAFTFATPIYYSNNYGAFNVTVGTQPAAQTCTVTNPNFGSSPANITWVRVSCAAATKYAYITDSVGVLEYSVSKGVLAALTLPSVLVGVTPYVTAGTNPVYVTTDPAGQYVYVVNGGSNSISQYTIGSDGTLTPMTTATVATGLSPIYMEVDPSGKYAYVVNSGDNTISQYTIGSGGALTPMTTATVATGISPYAIVISPNDSHAYVVNYGSSNVSQYSIGAGGALTSMTNAIVAAGLNSTSIAIDQLGKYAYVTGSNVIYEYTIDASGNLSLNGTVPLNIQINVPNGTNSPTSIKIDAYGNNAYIVSGDGTSQFSIDSNGLLSATGSPITDYYLYTSKSIVIDPTGMYAYVVDQNNMVNSYTIGYLGYPSLISGTLTPLSTAITGTTTGANATSIALAP